MGSETEDALRQQLAEANAVLRDPQKWHAWCDHRVLERAEAAEAALAEAEAEIARMRECSMIECQFEVRIKALTAALAALPDRVVQTVAELPDRTSPDDWPEAMLVTSDELRAIIADDLAALLAKETET